MCYLLNVNNVDTLNRFYIHKNVKMIAKTK